MKLSPAQQQLLESMRNGSIRCVSEMNEKPILFNAAMVRAILEGRKTQTRRPLKYQPEQCQVDTLCSYNALLRWCPFGRSGDRLWVRETWRIDGVEPPPGTFTKRLRVRYRADNSAIWFEQGQWPSGSVLDPEHWTPSIHMPRWASRITLEIVSVRVERVQDITNEDAKTEGVMPDYAHKCTDLGHPYNALGLFQSLWQSINAKTHSWDSNPFVWRIEFRKL